MNEEEKEVIEEMNGEWQGSESGEQPFDQKDFIETIRSYIQKGNVRTVLLSP